MATSKPPRPADLAIVGMRMLSGLLHRIWEINYKRLAPGNKAKSLVLMNIAFRVAIATHDGEPHTLTSLARIIDMPANTLRSHVAVLVKHHRVKMVASRKRGKGQESTIVANLDFLDGLMTVEHVKFCIDLIETNLNELKLLSALLMPQLIANGKKQAAE